MLVFAGRSSEELAAKVAAEGNFYPGSMERKTFPDGELYVRVCTDVENNDCTVVASVTGNDDLVDLALLLDALRDQKARTVSAVVPYLAYARQDKVFEPGEALSAKTVVKLLSALTDELATFNCHFLDESGAADYHDMRIDNLDAFTPLAEYFREKLDDPIVVAPDKGSLGYAKKAANVIGCDFEHLAKTRHSADEVSYEEKDLSVAGRDVLILDDIISTGGTIVSSAQFIRRQKPASINVGCVHGVFARGTHDLKKTVDRLVATDTIQRAESKVSVASVIAGRLEK